MPPYLGETQESVCRFLGSLDLSRFTDPFRMDEILDYVDRAAPDNRAAKASVDLALHDLVGKLLGQPWYKIWGLSPEKAPDTSFTIGHRHGRGRPAKSRGNGSLQRDQGQNGRRGRPASSSRSSARRPTSRSVSTPIRDGPIRSRRSKRSAGSPSAIRCSSSSRCPRR